MIKYILSFLLLANTASATINVKLVVAKSPEWMGLEESKRFRTRLSRYLRNNLDSRIRISLSYSRDLMNKRASDYETSKLISYSLRRGYSDKYHVVHYVDGTRYINGLRSVYGYAKRVCGVGDPNENVSYSNTITDSDLWISRSLVAAAHEIGHVLGAKHILTSTLMHPNANYYTTDELLQVDSVTKNEVRECLNMKLAI